MSNSLAIGIDLGTTYSAAAYINEFGLAEIIKNTEGEALTPSVIYFDSDNIIVGAEAKAQQEFGEDNVASFFKRNVGNSNYVFMAENKEYSAKELSYLLLKKLKQDIESSLGQIITNVVITVPAYFDNSQREETIEAAEKTGFKVLKIINEPTAAALSYGINNAEKEEKKYWFSISEEVLLM